MKRVVLTFGLIAAAIFAVVMPITMMIVDPSATDRGEILGYTMMVIAFLMVFFGIRSYRENVAGGTVSFGRAFQVGILIALVATAGYVVTWEVIYYKFMPDFGDRYAQATLDKAKASGATAEQLEARARDMAKFKEMYKNPLVNIGFTFIEAFPVGLVVALVSAGILRKGQASSDVIASARGAPSAG